MLKRKNSYRFREHNGIEKYFGSEREEIYPLQIGISLKITTYTFPSLMVSGLHGTWNNKTQSPAKIGHSICTGKSLQKAITWSNKCAIKDKEDTSLNTFNFQYLENYFFSPHHLCYFAFNIQGKVMLNIYYLKLF